MYLHVSNIDVRSKLSKSLKNIKFRNYKVAVHKNNKTHSIYIKAHNQMYNIYICIIYTYDQGDGSGTQVQNWAAHAVF